MITNTVCDIHTIMYIRFFFGFRQNVPASKILTIFSFLVPLFVLAANVVFILTIYYNKLPLQLITGASMFDYTVPLLMSFYTKDEFVYLSYKFVHGLDNLPSAKRVYKCFNRFIKLSLFYYITVKCFYYMIFCYNISTMCLSVRLSFLVFINYTWFLACDMGRFTIILVFGLFYCRTRIMRTNLESDLNNGTWDKYSVMKYINIYEMLADFLEIVEPVKIIMLGCLLSASIRFPYSLYLQLSAIREEGPVVISITWLLEYIGDPIVSTVAAAIVLDLINDNVNSMKLKFIEKKILSIDERQQTEIDRLLLLIENRPLRFFILPNIPLTFKLFLGSFSFFVVNIIAILQVKSFYSEN